MKTGIRVGGPATGGRNQFEFTLDPAERPGPEPEPKPTRRASHAELRGLGDGQRLDAPRDTGQPEGLR